MKRIFAAVLAAVMLLTSCTARPAEETSPVQAAVESGVLTGVYAAAVQVPYNGRETTPMLPADHEDPDLAAYRYLSWNDTGSLQIITRTGDAEIAVDVEKNTRTAAAAMGENGIYTIEMAGEGAPTRLYHYDTAGNVIKAADISGFRPGDDKMYAWWPSLNSQLPILETDDGYILTWGSTVITLDEAFRNPVYQTHPSEITGLFRDEVQGTIWISYEDQGTVLRDTGSDTVLRLPDASGLRSRTVVGVHDGLVYCMDRKSVHRYSLPDETPEILMSFENSSLSETPVLAVLCPDGDQMHFSMVFASGTCRLMYFMPGDDIALSDITVLELAVSGQHPKLLNIVYAFNASQKDCRIFVNDYSRFNNADDMNAGLYRFRLDLETGILTPDQIYLTPLEYTDIVKNSPDMLCDLYTIDYSDAKYTPDDLWTAVRHAGEVDGKLYAVLARFELGCPVGLKEYTADLAGWDLEGFLDWAESLPDGEPDREPDVEYVMDAYGKKTARKPLAGNGDWCWIPFYEQGSFDDPLYVRYLNYLNSLPDVGPVIQQKRSSNADDLILSGDYYEDDILFDAGGENMYKNGTIKLANLTLSSINSLIRLMDTLGAESVSELNFVGYPSGRGRGIEVRDDYNSVFCIMSRCESPELAWKFAEFMLEQTAAESRQSPYNSLIPALKEHALALLGSIEGTEVFFGYVDNFIFNDPDAVERMKNNPKPGRFFTIDSAVTDVLTELLDSELLKLSDRILMDLRNILTEEESAMLKGEQTVSTTAEAVASRTAIYIAEKN